MGGKKKEDHVYACRAFGKDGASQKKRGMREAACRGRKDGGGKNLPVCGGNKPKKRRKKRKERKKDHLSKSHRRGKQKNPRLRAMGSCVHASLASKRKEGTTLGEKGAAPPQKGGKRFSVLVEKNGRWAFSYVKKTNERFQKANHPMRLKKGRPGTQGGEARGASLRGLTD